MSASDVLIVRIYLQEAKSQVKKIKTIVEELNKTIKPGHIVC